mmetsp:Transcript_46718/g.134564  ORF Transcript_46718/g.134564 Transcript_46718/m.134564 type:complete len:207 (+) Transcript_46718:868-1488(+)
MARHGVPEQHPLLSQGRRRVLVSFHRREPVAADVGLIVSRRDARGVSDSMPLDPRGDRGLPPVHRWGAVRADHRLPPRHPEHHGVGGHREDHRRQLWHLYGGGAAQDRGPTCCGGRDLRADRRRRVALRRGVLLRHRVWVHSPCFMRQALLLPHADAHAGHLEGSRALRGNNGPRDHARHHGQIRRRQILGRRHIALVGALRAPRQ